MLASGFIYLKVGPTESDQNRSPIGPRSSPDAIDAKGFGARQSPVQKKVTSDSYDVKGT